jgi:hypothetical protein
MRKGSLRVGVAVVGLLALGTISAFAALITPDNGTGTITLPPPNGEYVTPSMFHAYLEQGGVITAELEARHGRFLNVQRRTGGSLGGEVETFDSTVQLKITGRGPLAGWGRTISVPTRCETHVGPRTPGDPVQSFPTVMYHIEGRVTGDPDFDSLHIVGGSANGYHSPGHTTLTDRGDGTFQVDSTFNVSFRLEYQGSEKGALKGASGETEKTVVVTAVPPGSSNDTKPSGDGKAGAQ